MVHVLKVINNLVRVTIIIIIIIIVIISMALYNEQRASQEKTK